MRTRFRTMLAWSAVASACMGIAAAMAADPSTTSGNWDGIWEGGDSHGKISMQLELSSGGAVTGKVSVNSDQGDYSETLREGKLVGSQFSAKYNFPMAEGAEVSLEGTLNGNDAKGTWDVHQKGDNTAMMTGTWTVTKQ